jgi:putative ABC transport system permease protein
MKYFPLIWSGLWRKKLRTILTFLSIVIAFLLLGLLQGVNSALDDVAKRADLNGLFTYAKHTGRVPEAYRGRIATVPGVTGVSFSCWIGGYFRNLKNRVAALAVDPESYFAIAPERVPPAQLDALIHTRTGAIAGAELMKKYGWKLGDHVPIKSQSYIKRDGSYVWEMEIVGTYTVPDKPQWETALFFNYQYLDESRLQERGLVDIYYVHIKDPGDAAVISARIDALFANSPYETQTMSQKENIQAAIKQFGDVSYIVNLVVGCVFFTLLILTGNTMMQSIRERIPEFAVLKTLGYSGNQVLAFVFVEAVLLCLIAAAVGLAGAAGSFQFIQGHVGAGGLPLAVIPICLGYALLLALLTALLPALRVQRLSIIDALAGR